MAKGYWVGHLELIDPDGHRQKYMPVATAAVHKFDGQFIIRGGAFEQVEGSLRARHVVIEFPTYEAALACYRSPEYQAAKKIRDTTAIEDLVIVAGNSD